MGIADSNINVEYYKKPSVENLSEQSEEVVEKDIKIKSNKVKTESKEELGEIENTSFKEQESDITDDVVLIQETIFSLKKNDTKIDIVNESDLDLIDKDEDTNNMNKESTETESINNNQEEIVKNHKADTM